MNKVLLGVFIEGIPAELVWDLVELRGPEMGRLGNGLGDEIVMGAGGEDPVKPGLFVLVAGGSEGCAGEFLGIESQGWLLRRVTE